MNGWNRAIKLSHIFPVGFVLASLVLSGGCAGPSAHRASRASTPRIAEIGGIKIGYSTQEELQRSWGEGLTVVGGHPNSGRRWRVRDTDWIIATDGFLYSNRGLVIDGLQIVSGETGDPDFLNAPYARLDKKAFGWLGEISCGMTRDEVIGVLQRRGVPFKDHGEVLSVNADGFSEITSEENASFDQWEARLYFKDGKLSCLKLDAAHGRA
jgi:hypothetical protein